MGLDETSAGDFSGWKVAMVIVFSLRNMLIFVPE